MGQTTPPEWWEIVKGILSIPATILAILSSFYILQKAALERQKIKLETRKLELEILEKEKEFRSKGELLDKPLGENRLQSVLSKVLLDIRAGEDYVTNLLMGLLSSFRVNSTASVN